MEENNIQELEEMRQQLNILQEKLDQQDIVNEKLLKSSMKSKMSWIVKYIIGEVIAIPILAIMLSGIYVMFNLPFYKYIINETCGLRKKQLNADREETHQDEKNA